jgi:hypothetical protein
VFLQTHYIVAKCYNRSFHAANIEIIVELYNFVQLFSKYLLIKNYSYILPSKREDLKITVMYNEILTKLSMTLLY